MEQRLSKMERELAIIIQSQKEFGRTIDRIMRTLDKLVESDAKITILTERLSHIDRDLVESFDRVDKRFVKIEAVPTWIAKTITVIIVGALLSLILIGGTNGHI